MQMTAVHQDPNECAQVAETVRHRNGSQRAQYIHSPLNILLVLVVKTHYNILLHNNIASILIYLEIENSRRASSTDAPNNGSSE